ncbi:MAG: glycosyltransferase [Candidatus Woesearchaeota archaeon]
MNIAIITDAFLPYKSGIVTTIINQANELVNQGHSVIILRPLSVLYKKETPGLHPNIEVINIRFCVPSTFKGFSVAPPTVLPILKKIKKYNIEIVHIHTEGGLGWGGLYAAKASGIPVIGTFHTFFADEQYLKMLKLPSNKIMQKAIWKASTSFFNMCDVVITPSKFTAKIFQENGLKQKPIIISNGIQYRGFKEKPLNLYKKYKLDPHKKNLLYVGRVSYEKSLSFLVSVMKKLPDYQLVIIGGGKYESEIKKQISDLKLQKQVFCLGPIPNVELLSKNYFSMGDIFVTASKTENQPVSILEAMSFGLPLLVAHAKGLPEMVYRNGYTFNPDDELDFINKLKLFEKKGVLKKASENSLKLSKKNAIENSAKKLVQVYKIQTQHIK